MESGDLNVAITREYYDSREADEFYYRIWGGEDIHVGMYIRPEDTIQMASRRTVEHLAAQVDLTSGPLEILDLGSGYGGAARYLAALGDHQITCLNLSQVQNKRNREMSIEAGLGSRISVIDGNFESIPIRDQQFDLVWCQDALLHSSQKDRVFAEVDRVLRPGGEFLFTDPMQQLGVDRRQLRPVLERIHLDCMGTVEGYEELANQLGWKTVQVDQKVECLIDHYTHVLVDLTQREEDLKEFIDPGFIERMKEGLKHWIDAGRENLLNWGVLHFKKKPEDE